AARGSRRAGYCCRRPAGAPRAWEPTSSPCEDREDIVSGRRVVQIENCQPRRLAGPQIGPHRRPFYLSVTITNCARSGARKSIGTTDHDVPYIRYTSTTDVSKARLKLPSQDDLERIAGPG